MKRSPAYLEPALATLPAEHRRVVAESVGAVEATPAEIAAVLHDDERLDALVRDLPERVRAATTELAFAGLDLWSAPGGRPATREQLEQLERRGLALSFESPWSLAYVAPLDLVPSLRRARLQAHASLIPDAPPSPRSLGPGEQVLHDAAAIGATIAHGGIQLKADGDLYARARTRLVAALAPWPEGVPDPGERRLDFALGLLQELGALRVAGDDLPGRNARRELALDADLPALLDRPFAQRAALTRSLQPSAPELALIDPLLDALAGRTIALDALGSALVALFDEARKHLAVAGDLSPTAIGSSAAHLRWMCGGASIGLGADGRPETVTLAPEPAPEPDGPPCVAQADFELVAMRPPRPHERAALLLLCEPISGREHVARLTRDRLHSAARALGQPDAAGVLGRLRELAGRLPQNVERSVADWMGQIPPRARLRSAIMVDVGSADLADRAAGPLGSLVVERLAPHLLAVRADDLAGVSAALHRAGIELDAGLNRVSGHWIEPPRTQERYEHWWRPSTSDGERTALPPGRLVSGLDAARTLPEPTYDLRQQILDRIQIDLDDADFDDELEPHEVVLEAFESGRAVALEYAAAGGTIVEHVTVEQVDGARFLVADIRGEGKRRWRWIRGVLDASLVRD